MKKKSKILQKLATFGLILATSMLAGGGYLLAPIGSVNSITLDDKDNQTSFVKVDELFNASTQTFNQTNFNILLKYITGNANATLATATALAETNNNQFTSYGYTGTDASVFRANTLSAGTEGSTAYSAKMSNIDVCVRLGGLDWQVMYLSKDKSGNTILTLWLDNNTQEAWASRSSTEGAYYGYLNGGLYSTFSANWVARQTDDEYPSHMYGASYINAVTLNNGGVYATNVDTSITVNKSTSSAFALFTMPQFGLTDYLVTPRNVSWQEEQSAKDICGESYRYPNEAYSDALDDEDFYDVEYNYSTKEYNDAWADAYLWLPSKSETGYSTSKLGLWNTSTTQRANYDGSTSNTGGKVGSSSKTAYTYSWLRSGRYSMAASAFSLDTSGATYSNDSVLQSIAVRPSLHLNLSAIAQSSITIDDGVMTVNPTSGVYDGLAKTPELSVTVDGQTLVRGVDYEVTYTLNGSSVSQMKDVGIYTITATGIGGYTGSLSATYSIITRATISIAIDSTYSTYDGSAKNPNITVKSDGTVLTKDTHYTITYSVLNGAVVTQMKSVGTYAITVTGRDAYSGIVSVIIYTIYST